MWREEAHTVCDWSPPLISVHLIVASVNFLNLRRSRYHFVLSCIFIFGKRDSLLNIKQCDILSLISPYRLTACNAFFHGCNECVQQMPTAVKSRFLCSSALDHLLCSCIEACCITIELRVNQLFILGYNRHLLRDILLFSLLKKSFTTTGRHQMCSAPGYPEFWNFFSFLLILTFSFSIRCLNTEFSNYSAIHYSAPCTWGHCGALLWRFTLGYMLLLYFAS